MSTISAFLVLLSVLLGHPPIRPGQNAVVGGATPEEVFEKALEANRQRDPQGLVALVAPSERGMVVLELFDGAAQMCTDNPEEGKDLCELLQRHGLNAAMAGSAEAQEAEYELDFNERQAKRRERASTIFADVDIPLFADELARAFITLGAPEEDTLFTYERLDSVKVEGDEAVGTEGERKLKFLREGGRWYLHWRGVM